MVSRKRRNDWNVAFLPDSRQEWEEFCEHVLVFWMRSASSGRYEQTEIMVDRWSGV